MSFDGASKETFEHYRKGARFEKVRDNFVRFARMKHERGSKMQIVVQMVRMPGNAHEVDEFRRFWSAVEGIDQVRVKEDETNLVQPEGRHARGIGAQKSDARPCHYLWRGAMYVKHDGRVFPCCQSYMLDGAPVGDLRTQSLEEIFNSDEMRRCGACTPQGRAGEDRHVRALLHRGSASAAGRRKSGAARKMGAPRDADGRTSDLCSEAAQALASASEQTGAVRGLQPGLGPDPTSCKFVQMILC